MRLMEALEIGKVRYPGQSFGTGFNGDKACVNATLWAGSGKIAVQEKWPLLASVSSKCPECTMTLKFWELNVHLNDDHRWTREMIVMWDSQFEEVDSLESEEEGCLLEKK